MTLIFKFKIYIFCFLIISCFLNINSNCHTKHTKELNFWIIEKNRK